MKIFNWMLIFLLELLFFIALLVLEQVGGAMVLSMGFYLWLIGLRPRTLRFTILTGVYSFLISMIMLIEWWQAMLVLFLGCCFYYLINKVIPSTRLINLFVSVILMMVVFVSLARVEFTLGLLFQTIFSMLVLIVLAITPRFAKLTNKQWALE